MKDDEMRDDAPRSGRAQAVKAAIADDVTGFVLLCVDAVFSLVLLASGFNFLALPALVLALVDALAMIVRALKGRDIGVFLFAAFFAVYASIFLYFLIWGADSFGRRLWWNLVLCFFPVALTASIPVVKKFSAERVAKFFVPVLIILVFATSLVYAMFMSLRARPTVERMWDGHDAYLDSVSARRKGSPNVLVILMDDMAYADISAYSYKYAEQPSTIDTPNIDSIAENGVMMDNFYAASPVCSPSRFSMLTGRYSSRGYLDNVVFPTVVDSDPWSPTHFFGPYQFLNNVDGILGDEITFAEVLQSSGYDTYLIGKWNLGDYGEYLPTEQGFDYFYGSYYVNDMTPYNWVRDTGEGYPGGASHEEVRTHAENLDQSMSTGMFTDELLSSIEGSVKSGNAFCTVYATPWPHYPIYSNNNGNGQGDTSDDSYIDCIEEFDRELGRVLDYLRTTPDEVNGGTLYDNTVVVFTSDNGPGREGAAGALRGRKNTTFEGGMKVPLLVSYPAGGIGGNAELQSTLDVTYSDGAARQLTTTRVQSSSMMFDLFTTILSLCGVTDGEGDVMLPTDRVIDGVDLSALWRGELDPDAPMHEALYYQKKGKVQAVQLIGVELDGQRYDFKYFDRVQSENSAFFDQYYNNYLFNLDLDPIEGYNISMKYPDIAARLADALDAFRAEMRTNRRGIK